VSKKKKPSNPPFEIQTPPPADDVFEIQTPPDDDEGPDDYAEYQEWAAENQSADDADDLYGDNYGPFEIQTPPALAVACAACAGTADCHCVSYYREKRFVYAECEFCLGTGDCSVCQGRGEVYP